MTKESSRTENESGIANPYTKACRIANPTRLDDQLNDFYDFLDSEINNNGAIDMNINIQNNPNNAGGGAVPNVNE